MTITCPYR